MNRPRTVRTTIRAVAGPTDPAVAKAHRMLGRIFPKSELVRLREWRETLREHRAGLWTDTRWFLLVAERDGRVVGVATGTYLGNVNAGVIGYLAITATARRLGIGPRLRRRLVAAFTQAARQVRGAALGAIVGEVRRDNPWLRTLARRDHVLALDFPYLQPRLHADAPAVPLVLYVESPGRTRHRMRADDLRRLLYTIWRRIYRIARPMAEPAFRQMMRALAGRRWIGEVTVSRRPHTARR